MQNVAAFPMWAADTFRYAHDTETTGYSHMVQQRFVRDYLQYASPYRGLLLYHGLGSGKTCSAIAASEALRTTTSASTVRKVFVMLPATLRANYVREIKKCGGEVLREVQSWRRAADAWVPDSSAGVPFEQLSPADREEVRLQVDAAVQRTHVFVSYNGLSTKRVDEMCDPTQPNMFEDAVVVIDEAHNFVSAVANGRLLSRVYQRIMDARRCKVVLLSGTPLVNEPHELALLVNLVHGYVHTHTFRLKSALDDSTVKRLRACPDVHEIHEEPTGRSVVVRTLPEGFVRVDSSGHIARADPDLAEQLGPDGTARIRDLLDQTAGVASHTTANVLLLPSDPDVFRANFVSENRITNAHVLERRMLGTVSFFRGHAESLYPKLRRMLIVRTPMSPRQFSEYTVQRTTESRKEDAARRFAGMRKNMAGVGAGESFAGLKAFSRAVCNFTFPEEVPRPRKSDFKIYDHDSDNGDDATTGTGAGAGAYEQALDAAADAMRAMPGRLTLSKVADNTAGLDELSPKFAAILRHLLEGEHATSSSSSTVITRSARGPDVPVEVTRVRARSSSNHLSNGGGTAIVYSQFRRAEGVNLLAAALDANGFSQMRIVRPAPGAPHELVNGQSNTTRRYIVYDNNDPVAASYLLAIFNNKLDDLPPSLYKDIVNITPQGRKPSNLRGELARVLLITRSGAEGISTQNVREVHVMEPFWHANRIEQVVGRARRVNSHDDLPPAERTVDVYIYMASMTPQQAALHKRDDGKSSDEYLHDIAQRKRVILKSMYDIMRRAAVDCRLYSTAGPKHASCYTPPSGIAPDAALYPVDVADDIRMAHPAKLVAVRLNGKLFYADMDDGILYDHEALRIHNRVIRVGLLPQTSKR